VQGALVLKRAESPKVDLLRNVQHINAVAGYLGEFEQLILLALARLGDEAYGPGEARCLVELPADSRGPLTMGRYFTEREVFGPGDTPLPGTAEQRVVVSAEFERRFFPNGAVDRKFRYVYGGNYELSVHHRVLGVVGDVKRQEVTDDARPAYYLSYRQGEQFAGSEDPASEGPRGASGSEARHSPRA